MRITMIELSPSGGLYQFTFQLGDQLARAGHDVELVTGPDPELTSSTPGLRVRSLLPTWHAGSSRVDSVVFHRLRRPVRAVRHVLALLVVLVHLLRRRPEVVFWHPLRFPVDSWVVRLAGRITRARMTTIVHEPKPLAEQHGARSHYRESALVDRALEGAMRSMDGVFVLSEKVRQYVATTYPPKGPITVIPHGDEAVFLPDEGIPGAEATPPHVLFFGTWLTHKGIDELLSAFEQVRTRVPEARLTMAGAVGNADYRGIAARAARIGGVDLRPGYVPVPETAALMGRHRVVAVPYLRANQSGVVHLAQTFSRPCVATRVGDIPDVVTDGVNGLLVDPGDVPALAEALTRLLRDPAEAGLMGAAAAKAVETSGSWADIAATVGATLEDLL
jgi:glycosyltransferase involved in cell wall biosynthesis